jgi:ABC-2 type transport system permease protein/oleandomycin transport system permease protein
MTAVDVPLAAKKEPIARRASLSQSVRDAGTIAHRSLLDFVRTPPTLLFSTVQPVVAVLTFRYVFGGSIFVPAGSYVDYLMPGIFVLTVCFGAINTGVGVASDMQTGLVERFRSLPMARSAVLTGRIVADIVRTAVTIAIMVGVGFLVGFRLHTAVVAFIAGLALLLVFGIGVCWILAAVGVFTKNPEGAQAAAFPLMTLLVFISNAFVSTRRMPAVLRVYADHQPVTAAVNAARALMLGGPAANRVEVTLLWTAVLTVAFTFLSVSLYERSAQ